MIEGKIPLKSSRPLWKFVTCLSAMSRKEGHAGESSHMPVLSATPKAADYHLVFTLTANDEMTRLQV